MARIAGVNIPTDKRVHIALTYIHGIGNTKAKEITTALGIDEMSRVNQLSDDQVVAIREKIDADYLVEGELRTQVRMNIKRLQDMKCYRGLRHRRKLPVRELWIEALLQVDLQPGHHHLVGAGAAGLGITHRPLSGRGRAAGSQLQPRGQAVCHRRVASGIAVAVVSCSSIADPPALRVRRAGAHRCKRPHRACKSYYYVVLRTGGELPDSAVPSAQPFWALGTA